MSQLNDLIGRAAAQNASDIHLTVGLPPVFRIDGALQNDGEAILDEEAVAAMAKELANQRQIEELEHTGEVDFAVTVASSIRMRCNIFRQQGYTALALRLLPLRIPTAEELLLPQIIIEQAEKPRGLVLITGPTGSGKSSTLAALLDHINRTERRHIITLENPIEYVHERIQCVINQREVGSDTGSFAYGLRASFGNMLIAKREVFCAYSAWMFPLLEEFERLGAEQGVLAPRMCGFISEYLLCIWADHNFPPEKILFMDVANTEDDRRALAYRARKALVKLGLLEPVSKAAFAVYYKLKGC